MTSSNVSNLPFQVGSISPETVDVKYNDDLKPLYASLVHSEDSSGRKSYNYNVTYRASQSGSGNKSYPALFDGIHILPAINEYTNGPGPWPETVGQIVTMFCISREHPLYKEHSSNFVQWLNNNNYDESNSRLRICHSIGMGIQDGESHILDSNISIYSKMQSEFDSNLNSPENYYETIDAKAKVGFYDDDKYLIGKMTCGAYLYINPSEYSYISIQGNSSTSGRKVSNSEATMIDIPLIFQYRCTDYPYNQSNPKGYIGRCRIL